jgi:hypothetical protein
MSVELSPERQFDFWLGTWDVSWGEDGGGTNRVELLFDGGENWELRWHIHYRRKQE